MLANTFKKATLKYLTSVLFKKHLELY